MNSGVYMNEWDRFPANWLRALYPAAAVDERSIADVRADELAGYERCHFFAGIGGWEYALELSGWPAGVPVWTGSCPCQPFSAAGKGLGEKDPRHLWPEFRRLISECRPPVVFGEQVASKAGRAWLAGVRADLEAMGYAVGAADLCAAGVGAPHIRQRLYWVAYRDDAGQRTGGGPVRYERHDAGGGGETSGGVVNAMRTTEQRLGLLGVSVEPEQEAGRSHHAAAWSDHSLVQCADGKARRVEPGVCPLAHGVPGRVGQLRGYGNAIVPQVAAQFVSALLESIHA